MTTYLIIDTLNNFMRCKHVVHGDTAEDKAGMAVHINFMSLRKMWNKFNADHTVFCLEGRSWRKEVYPKYKANRVAEEETDPDAIELNDAMWQAYEDFVELVNTSNATVLKHSMAEADDMIARWIATHPDDKHIIISSDSDFVQLVSDKVYLYNGVTNALIKPEGVFDDRDRALDFSVKNDGKIRVGKTVLGKNDEFPERPDWIDYALFTKIVRGDKGDNIFSACEPGTRQKGSKKKVGIQECFENRQEQGYEWFNFMNHRWVDHESKQHIVRDLFEFNEMLIDLNKMPTEIKEAFDDYIESYEKPPAKQLGFHFLRFAEMYQLEDIKKDPNKFVEMINATPG